MAQVKVKAKSVGYFEHRRIREGVVFFMDESFIKLSKDGEVLTPKWIELVEPMAKKNKKQKVSEEVTEEVLDNSEVI